MEHHVDITTANDGFARCHVITKFLYCHIAIKFLIPLISVFLTIVNRRLIALERGLVNPL